jgi:outer membrane lipoprotein-sorting protein
LKPEFCSIRVKTVARFRLLFLAILLLSATGTAWCEEPLQFVLEGLKEKYGHLSGLKVGYTREIITRSMSLLGGRAQGDRARGHIFFKPPHFLRLEQKAPAEETVLTDGTVMWWYVPEKREAYTYDAGKFGKELGLLSDIFRGLAHAGERFGVTCIPAKESGETRLELTPVPAWEEIDRIVVTLTGGYGIRVVEIHNMLGTVTRFTLDAIQEMDAFDSGFFHFEAPEGVRVVEQGEM